MLKQNSVIRFLDLTLVRSGTFITLFRKNQILWRNNMRNSAGILLAILTAPIALAVIALKVVTGILVYIIRSD